MALITLPKDIADIEDGGNSVVPAGTYEAKIERADVGTTKKGDTKITIWWRIPENNGIVFDTIPITEKAAFKIKPYAALLGIDAGSQIDSDELVGVDAIVEVVGDTYNGKPTARIKRISPME